MSKNASQIQEFKPAMTGEMLLPTKRTHFLNRDMLDTYFDLKKRFIDGVEHKNTGEMFEAVLRSPVVLKALREVKPVGIEVVRVHVPCNLAVYTRRNHGFPVYVHIVPVEGKTFPEDEKELKKLDDDYLTIIARAVATQHWWKDLIKNDRLDIGERSSAVRMIVNLSYNGKIPDVVMINAYYRSFETYMPQLDPLLFFFHSLMTETIKFGPQGYEYTFDANWVPFDISALLVCFFYQHCSILPLINKDTKIFHPGHVNWNKIDAWNAGYPYFDTAYSRKFPVPYECCSDINKFCDHIRQNAYASTTTGSLFVAFLKFYSEICEFGRNEIDFDEGTWRPLKPSESHRFIIKTVLLKSKLALPRKELYRIIIKAWYAHIDEIMKHPSPKKRMMEIRDDLIKKYEEKMRKF